MGLGWFLTGLGCFLFGLFNCASFSNVAPRDICDGDMGVRVSDVEEVVAGSVG